MTDLGLTIEGLNGDEMVSLFGLRQTLGNSSLADVSCYFLARERRWPLLTGDGALRKSGQQGQLEVRGVLWILDELERHALLSTQQLADALDSMLKAGARLPKEECRKRLNRWR